MSAARDPRFPPGWWIVPAFVGGAFLWMVARRLLT